MSFRETLENGLCTVKDAVVHNPGKTAMAVSGAVVLGGVAYVGGPMVVAAKLTEIAGGAVSSALAGGATKATAEVMIAAGGLKIIGKVTGHA